MNEKLKKFKRGIGIAEKAMKKEGITVENHKFLF